MLNIWSERIRFITRRTLWSSGNISRTNTGQTRGDGARCTDIKSIDNDFVQFLWSEVVIWACQWWRWLVASSHLHHKQTWRVFLLQFLQKNIKGGECKDEDKDKSCCYFKMIFCTLNGENNLYWSKWSWMVSGAPVQSRHHERLGWQ